jgi:hypothetical protein
MRRATIGILTLGALTLAGCGGGAHFADKSRPATPTDLTVYINNSRVLVSPNSIGAGPVIFIITNQASQSESLTIQTPGGSTVASTAPINPQATSEVQVNFNPGAYTMTTGRAGATDAQQAQSSPIQPASLYIGPARPNANNVLLQP